MRYVPMSLLEPGMALGQDIYDGTGRMLLAKHLILNPEYIKGLDDYGFPGAYIDDSFSEGIEIKEVIRPEIKREALSIINNMFVQGQEEYVSQRSINAVVKNIVECVIDHGDVMCNMLDIKRYDDYTYFHCVNVGVLAAMVGAGMKLSEEDLVQLTTAGILHDVGKRFIPVEVLNARHPLNQEQLMLMHTHAQAGTDFIREKYYFSGYVHQGILQHHEWYNGKGYPLGRKGEEIPLFARIIKLVDVYDALTSNRPYRPAVSNADAVEYLMASSGQEFDPEVLDTFLHKIAIYPVGAQVELSDGRQAVVMENHDDLALRPKIKLLKTLEVVDLGKDPVARNMTITKIIMN